MRRSTTLLTALSVILATVWILFSATASTAPTQVTMSSMQTPDFSKYEMITTTTAPPTTTTTIPPRTTKQKATRDYKRPDPSTEPIHIAPAPTSSDAYSTCLAAAASVKGSKTAPNVARWSDLVVRFFPGEITKTCRVMACESSGNPGAVGPRQPNGSYPQGLMQILGGPFDPEANLRLAASMRASRGWAPWACK